MIFDCFFLPVRIEDEGDEEGDVEGGHTHPGAVILSKKLGELMDDQDGEADLHDGEGVEGEVGDGEDEGGGEEELGEVVEEAPEEEKDMFRHLFGGKTFGRAVKQGYTKGLPGTWSM